MDMQFLEETKMLIISLLAYRNSSTKSDSES